MFMTHNIADWCNLTAFKFRHVEAFPCDVNWNM